MAAVLVALALSAHVLAAVPPDWADRVSAGQMLFAAAPPSDGAFPNIGNGFIGTTVGCSGPNFVHDPDRQCGVLYMAGVFNGHSFETPSHRAALPAPYSVAVSLRPPESSTCSAVPREKRQNCGYPDITVGQCEANGCCFIQDASPECFYAPDDPTRGTIQLVGAALDLERGAVYNRSVISGASDCAYGAVEQTSYAHRGIRQLLVHTISVSGIVAGASCRVYLSSCAMGAITDFDYKTSAGTPGVMLATATTLMAETSNVTVTTAGIAWNPVPSSILFTSEQPSLTFLAVYHSSLEDGVAGHEQELAEQDLQRYSAMNETDLFASHAAAWAVDWQGGIEMTGNLTIAASINSSLYYILASMRSDWPYSSSPGGIAVDAYHGHSFWDCETWMFPNLVLLNPPVAASMLTYRLNRIAPAAQRARDRLLKGLMWPWESAFTGVDCVQPPNPEGKWEIHISGDIPMAFRLFYRMSHNDTFLRESWPVIYGSAAFFASRVVHVDDTTNYTLLHVQPPDERAGLVDSSVYTNAVAGQTLLFAVETAHLIGEEVPAEWETIGNSMWMPLTTKLYSGGPIHPEYQGYNGQPINQADVALLQYPLGMPMPEDVARNDLVYYQERSSGPGTSGFYTGDSAYSIAWIRLNNLTEANAQFQLAFSHMDLGHFNVWTETNFGDLGHRNFITGAGGYVQNILNGYAGMNLLDYALAFNPILPPGGVTSLKLRSVNYLGARFSVEYNSTYVTMTALFGPQLLVTTNADKRQTLGVGLPNVVYPVQPLWITAYTE